MHAPRGGGRIGGCELVDHCKQLPEGVAKGLCEGYFGASTPLDQWCAGRGWLIDSTFAPSCEWGL